MKLRDLFNVILKVFGLFIIKDILATLPYLISPILQLIQGDEFKDVLGMLIISLLILAIYFSIAYALLFKTNSLLNFLKLEPEFMEDRLAFEISTKNIMTVAIIILGGYILIDEIPNFCNYIFKYYEQSQISFSTTKPGISNLIISGVKILIAFLIIGERKRIILYAQKDEVSQQEE